MFFQSLKPKSNLKYNDLEIVFHFDNMASKPPAHLLAGNKTRKINTELSMPTIYIFVVAMVTSLVAFNQAIHILPR